MTTGLKSARLISPSDNFMVVVEEYFPDEPLKGFKLKISPAYLVYILI
jgi:hypothetical protein